MNFRFGFSAIFGDSVACRLRHTNYKTRDRRGAQRKHENC